MNDEKRLRYIQKLNGWQDENIGLQYAFPMFKSDHPLRVSVITFSIVID